MRPPRPGFGPPGMGGQQGFGRQGAPPPGIRAVDNTVPRRSEAEDRKSQRGLIDNSDFEVPASGGKSPRGFALTGDFIYSYLGNPTTDRTGWGVRLLSGKDSDGDGKREAALTATVRNLKSDDGRWFRLRIRGLAQEGFASSSKQLFLKAEFFAADGTNSLDHVSKNLYSVIEQARKEVPSGDTGTLAAVRWTTHVLEFRTPFPEVDTLKLSVAFRDGSGEGTRSEFMIDEMELTRIPDPADYVAQLATKTGERAKPSALVKMKPLGGRWYYDPRDDKSSAPVPERFDRTNADRLYYLTDRLEAPFAENTTAYLRRGYLDLKGNKVEQDRFVADNVVVSFTPTHLVVKSHNLPNHPTAVFPDNARVLDGSHNYIQEQDDTWYIPLEPKENPEHVAFTSIANRYVMPPGPIGIAINGVVFFDPYDADATEAFWRLDRCCGHPSPRQQYHYHKYPVCVKSPWADDGQGHSPLIGFAFDGFPVYGPYESASLMAKDLAKDANPLNAFNLHTDPERGSHYHVTPGRFPHILGGYFGTLERKNVKGPGGRGQGPALGGQ